MSIMPKRLKDEVESLCDTAAICSYSIVVILHCQADKDQISASNLESRLDQIHMMRSEIEFLNMELLRGYKKDLS